MLSKRYDVYKVTDSDAVAFSIAPGDGQEFRLAGFTLHSDGALAAESITFTTDDLDGSAYDTVILSVSLDGLTDKAYMVPDDERVPLKKGTELDVAFANSNSDTIGLKVFIEKE